MADRYVSSSADGSGDGTSPASPWTLAQARTNANGDVVWIKADGPYLLNSLGVGAFDPSNAGNRFRGYISTPGDADEPVVTFDAQGQDADVVNCTRDDTWFENILFRNTSVTGTVRHGVRLAGTANVARRCRATLAGGAGFYLTGVGCLVVECEADDFAKRSSAWAGFSAGGVDPAFVNCFAHHGAGPGYRMLSTSAHPFVSCVSADNADAGFLSTQASGYPLVLHYCVSIRDTSAIWFEDSAGAYCQVLGTIVVGATNVFKAHTTGFGRASVMSMAHFDAENLTAGNVFIREIEPVIALSADPFVDSSAPAYDIRLKAACRELLGTAGPRHFVINGQRTIWRSFADYGAVQQPIRPAVNPFFGW